MKKEDDAKLAEDHGKDSEETMMGRLLGFETAMTGRHEGLETAMTGRFDRLEDKLDQVLAILPMPRKRNRP